LTSDTSSPAARGRTSPELSHPAALADRRIHYGGFCLPTGSAFRVCLPSWRFPPRRTSPTLFQIGSAHGFRPSKHSPSDGRLSIPAALTHVPSTARTSIRPKTNGNTCRTGFWALIPPKVPCGWTEPLGPAAAGCSPGLCPS